MLMKTLQQLTAEMHRFVESQGWYGPHTRRPQTMRNLAISLSLEANEVLEHFQWRENTTDRDALAGELADVALYLMQIASLANIDLEKAIMDKLAQNYGRSWDQAETASPDQSNE